MWQENIERPNKLLILCLFGFAIVLKLVILVLEFV
ncbi:uncharacterized protein LOC133844050 [Drosophila sulfurigaster albostrigata]|nr:uncharacterized protein LOC133844050 [Drosophila sulfurigaster albostrigata]